MKKLIIFACSLMAGVSASAQDVLITKDGDVKNVYEVEVGNNAVFYKPKSLSMLISKCFDHYFQFMLRFYIQG